MDEALEWSIRREYSRLDRQLSALTLWVGNTFRELCLHDEFIYDFKIRTKKVESLIGKVDKRIQSGTEYASFDDVLANIDDLVGARLITLEPEELLTLHGLLTNFKRIEVSKCTVHYPVNRRPRIVDQVLISSEDVQLVTEENRTGYFGIHYVLRPRPYDEFYRESDVDLYPKFELQARTLMHHAWSEIQHRIIYKGDLQNDYKKDLGGRFSILANMIAQCDEELGNLRNDSASLTPTYRMENASYPAALVGVAEEIRQLIGRFEQEGLKVAEKSSLALGFCGKYRDQIESALAASSDEAYNFSMEWSELMLKSGHYERAYEQYLRCKVVNGGDPWLLLRLAETCDALTGKMEECATYIERLRDYVEQSRSRISNAATLYAGAALIAWKRGRYADAVWFGEKAVICADDEFNANLIPKTRANLLYYKIDYIDNTFKGRREEQCRLLQELVGLGQWVEEKLNDDGGVSFPAAVYDTVAWFYFKLADACTEKGKMERIAIVDKAVSYIKECLRVWLEREMEAVEVHESWRFHKIEIFALRDQLNGLGD